MATSLSTSQRSTSRSPSPLHDASQGDTSNEGNGAAAAVDLSAIEQQKENIQPLTSGRSAKALHTLFTSDRKVLQDELEKGHEKFKCEIDQAEEEGSDDPLDVYHRYVRWTLASYPSGPSHASHLVPLLERSTRRFVHEEQYKSDIRLLKLWLLYAKYVDCPKDIFRFLEGLQCGTSLAGFYEEWALLEEQSNNLQAADAIYNLGLARRAQPLERLKKRRDAFQARMLLPRPAALDEPSSSSALSRSTSTTQRSILGGSSAGPAFRGTAASQSSSKAALPNNGASSFAVFKDEGQANAATSAALASQETWSDFGTNASRKRENERAAVGWKGETLPAFRDADDNAALSSSRPVSLSSSMKFEVFRDDDAEIPATDLGASQNRGDAGGLSLARSIRAPPEADLLRSDPFRHYQKNTVILAEIPDLPFATTAKNTGLASTSGPSRPSKTRVSSSSKSKPTSSQATSSSSSSTLAPGDKRKERVASPLHEIYPEGANGPEYSFEELLAAKRHLRKLKNGQPGSRSVPSDEPWQVEARELRTPWKLDANGEVLLRDPHSGEALFKYLQKQDEQEQESKLDKRKRLAEEQEACIRKEAEAKAAAEAAEAGRVEREKQQQRERGRQEAQLRAQQEEVERRAAAEQRAKTERHAAEERAREEEAERVRQLHEQRLRLEEENEARKQAERDEAERNERMKQKAAEEEAKARRFEEERLQAEAEAEAQRLAEEIQEDGQDLFDDERSASPQLSSHYRPPSPTINTKAALAEVNAMFGKTMRFDGHEGHNEDYDSSATEQSVSSENDFDSEPPRADDREIPFAPSQAETDGSFWSAAQSQSQQPFSQPFSTQQSLPSDSQSSSLGFPSASESGETTEESDNESDLAVQRPNHLDPMHQLHQSLSRSSSSSSSSASFDRNVPLQASLRSHVPAFTPFKELNESDENTSGSLRKDGSAFKPSRTPLGMKPVAINSALSMKPAFSVFCEEEEENRAPSSAQQSEQTAEEHDDGTGYGMGRRPAGNNRFANMMDIMTPITERTCEFGMQTATMTASQGGNVHARMLTDGQSEVEDLFDQGLPEDLASSRGSNWDAGRRLEQIDEEADYSSQIDGTQEPSNTSTVLASTTLATEACARQDGACDPLAAEVLEDILYSGDRPVTSVQGLRDYRHQVCAKLDDLRRAAKSRRKSAGANSSRSSMAHEETPWQIELHQDVFSVREKLGEGGFGSVYRVVELLDTFTDNDDDDIAQTALKVESPPNLWEFYILSALQICLPERTKMSIIKAHRMYAFKDESYLLLDYCDQGSLLDAVNHAHDAGIGPSGTVSTGVEEVLAIFFTIELTRILECLHTYRFLHGDFKIDNCLVRLEDVPGGAARNWSNGYKADGSGGWKHKGVSIIDFGRAVDLDNFHPGQTFTTDIKTENHDCIEVQEGRAWVYQPDYFGLACIAHVLLFGKYLEVVSTGKDAKTGRPRHAIKEPLKRYHQANLWNRFFDILLNPTSFTNGDPAKAVTGLLKDCRHDMERWLEANSDKNGKSLKSLLKKMEIWALSRQ